MGGPEGRLPKREPSPEGLGINPEDDLSAVGAGLNLGPLAPGRCGCVLHLEHALLQNGAQIFAIATFRYPGNQLFQLCGVDPT